MTVDAVNALLFVYGTLVSTVDTTRWHGDVGWFGVTDPSARTPVRITLDGGQDSNHPRSGTRDA